MLVGAVKRYGSGMSAVVALDDVTIALPAGKFTAVMGPSGSGKSTMMHCAAGLDRLTSGRAFVGSTGLSTLDDRELTKLRREKIGFVFQTLVVTSATPDFATIDPSLAGRIAALPDVDAVTALSIGIAVAAGFGWALIDVTGGMEIPSVVIPWPRLAATLVVAVAVAAGVLAAAWPTFRVSRVPVLELASGGR